MRSRVDNKYLKRIIEAEINQCFDTYDGGYEDWGKWAATQYLRSLEIKDKPPDEERTSPCVTAEMQTKLEKAELGIPTTGKGSKRVASTKKPCESTRAAKKRLDLIVERARLQIRIEEIDAEVSKMEQKDVVNVSRKARTDHKAERGGS